MGEDIDSSRQQILHVTDSIHEKLATETLPGITPAKIAALKACRDAYSTANANQGDTQSKASQERAALAAAASVGRVSPGNRGPGFRPSFRAEPLLAGPQRRKASEQSPERDEPGRVNVRVLTSDLHGGCGPKLTHGLLRAPLAGRDTVPTAHHP